MKYTLLLAFIYVNIYADTPQKVWIITDENSIQTTEGQISSTESTQSEEYYVEADTTDYNPMETETVVNDTSIQYNLEDMPLAKTYPVDEVKTVSEKKPLKVSPGSTATANMQQRIDEIKKIIDAQMQKKYDSKKSKYLQKSERSQSALDTGINTQNIKADEKTDFPDKSTFLYIVSGLGTTLLSFILYFLLRNQNSRKYEAVKEKVVSAESFAIQLERFYALKAEVRHQFILRKQNILFNSDFTQYQKAKALIELEKEYTDLEYIYLPKLMSNDFLNFVEGKKQLIERIELRKAVQEFTDSILHKKKFSKMQKEHILNMMKETYNTSNHIWQYDDKIEQQASIEKSYLLQ